MKGRRKKEFQEVEWPAVWVTDGRDKGRERGTVGGREHTIAHCPLFLCLRLSLSTSAFTVENSQIFIRY